MGRTRMGLAGAALGAMLLGGCGIVGGGDEPSVSPAAAAAPAAPRGTAAPAELVDATATLARVAPAQPERLTYLPPTGDAAPALDQQLAQDPAMVFDSVQRALRDGGLRITHLDERAGIITATYAGDGSAFVDCGTITAVPIRGEQRLLEASAEAISFRRGQERDAAVVERELVLNARLVLRLRPDGAGTRLRSSVTYVLTKRLTRSEQLQAETVAFESGGRGSFAKGTICQPTGALERLPLVTTGA
jgi:hypothetical protein